MLVYQLLCMHTWLYKLESIIVNIHNITYSIYIYIAHYIIKYNSRDGEGVGVVHDII